MRIRETLFASTMAELDTLFEIYETKYPSTYWDTELIEAGINDGFARYYLLFERNQQSKEGHDE